MTLFQKLQDVIATALNVPASSISETTTDKDIAQWDSMGHVNLLMALEQTFDIQVDVEDFPTLNSVPAILDYLKARNIAS